MTEMNFQISKNEILPCLQMKNILFKIIQYNHVVYEFNPTII